MSIRVDVKIMNPLLESSSGFDNEMKLANSSQISDESIKLAKGSKIQVSNNDKELLTFFEDKIISDTITKLRAYQAQTKETLDEE